MCPLRSLCDSVTPVDEVQRRMVLAKTYMFHSLEDFLRFLMNYSTSLFAVGRAYVPRFPIYI